MSSDLLNEVDADLRKAPCQIVVYLEGKTDPDIFFALLGVSTPRDGIHDGVLVRGLKEERNLGRAPGTGSIAVESRVHVAATGGRTGVFGICDGDGRDLTALMGEFDAPFAGPLFRWKGYCIENLLAQAVWPGAWGAAPNWAQVLNDYAPYVGLNRLHMSLRSALQTLGLHKFRNPEGGQPLLAAADVTAALGTDKHLIEGRDVESDFAAEVAGYQAAIATSLAHGHALLNGKWLITHFAPSIAGLSADACRAKWAEAARSNGGHPPVRDWWTRTIGSAP